MRDKIIYCNCDTPESNFVKFLNDIKDEWGIKDVWHTSLQEGISYDSDYARKLLRDCDIVITNPPFSQVREKFLPLIFLEYNKDFLFIGNLNMATMKNIFPLIRDGYMWTGYTHPKQFDLPDGGVKKFGNTLWWTNLFVDKQITLNPDNHFSEDKYPMYDNYAGWNVDKLNDIPVDTEIETTLNADKYEAFRHTYGEDCELLSQTANEYRVKIHSPIWGVPVTFVEHFAPPYNEQDYKPRKKIGGHFGSKSLGLDAEQTNKTLKQTDDTAICDTLSVLDYNKNLIGGGETKNTSADYSFALHDLIVGHKCDIAVCAERERERDEILPDAHSQFLDMNTTCIEGGRTSDSLKSTNRVFTNESLFAGFSIIGVTEENGIGLSGGGRIDDTPAHVYINGNKKYTRLLLRLL